MHSNNISKLFWQTTITNSILFLIVILTVSSISFNTVTDILHSEMNIANKTILDQTKQNIDSQLKNIDMYISNLSKDSFLNEFTLNSSPDAIKKYTANTMLTNAVNKNSMINNIYVYSDVSKRCISYPGVYETLPENLDAVVKKAIYENVNGWVDAVSADGTLLLVKTLYNKKAAIAVKVSETLLYETISKYRKENKNGIFFVVNQSGVILSHNDKSYIGTNISSDSFTQHILTQKQSVEPYKTKYLQQDSLMFHRKSEYTGWTYVSTIPETVFTKQISRGKLHIYILSTLIFLISVSLAYLLVKKMYMPVDKFVHSVASSIMKNRSSGIKTNKFGTLNELEKTLSELVEEQKVLQSEHQKNAKAMSWNIIMNMLLGFDMNYDKFIPTLETTNIILYPNNFVVLMLDISRQDDIPNEKSDEAVFVFNLLHQKLDSLINQETKGCTCVVGDHSIFAIISFENNSEPENSAYTISIANDLIEFSKKYFEYTLCVSIGNFYEDVSGLHKSYTEAVCAMKYKSINQNNSILMIDNYIANPEESDNLSAVSETVNDIVKDFKSLEEEELINRLHKLKTEMISEKVSVDICKQFALQIIMLTVNHYIKPVELYSHTQLSNRYLNSNQIIDSCTDITSVMDNLTKILKDILDVFNETQSINFSQNNLVSQVIDYIDKNYMDPLTSLSTTAQKFKVSDSHLSRVFKSSTGKRFMEYLIYKRVEKAKELLVSSQHKVNDISALVGYDNQISFMRIFKKYTGVTPSEYRSMYSDK